MNSWMRHQTFEFASVRYESLYQSEVLGRISDFLGVKIKVAPQRSRQADWRHHPERRRLELTYSNLAQKIEEADDFKVWGAVGPSHQVNKGVEYFDIGRRDVRL